MTRRINVDAVVIGAGVIGAATAYELSKQGRAVICVDKLPSAGYGSTSSSCAIIRVHYSTVAGTAFAYDGFFDWLHWAKYLGLSESKEESLAKFCQTGCLVMKTESNNYLKNVVANVEALSIPFENWTPQDILSRLPNYDLRCFAPAKTVDDPHFGEATSGEVSGAAFFPTAGFISDPQLATQNIKDAAENARCEFIFNRRVIKIPSENGQVRGVVLDDGTEIVAPVVVNVGGPHSSELNKLAGADVDMRITTRALRQEVAHVPAPGGLDFEKAGLVVSDSDLGVYCRPENENFVLVGSEDPPCDSHQWIDNADSFDRDLSNQAMTQALRLAQRMGGLEFPSRMRGVVDLYDVTEDWMPIYDRSIINGFYMACGSSGNQFKNAPAAGRLMAGLIDYCEAGNDHDMSPFQFSLEHIEYKLDTGEMSRLRRINPESSFSVLG